MMSQENITDGFSQDYLLGGKVLIKQPTQGYRVAIDPIFLAASIDVQPGDAVLDIGAGVGAASLCLATRVPYAKVTGVELQRDYVRCAAENVKLNNLRGRVEILHGDLLRPPPRLAAGTFSHVMTNPPYLDATRNNISPNENKAMANLEGEADLDQWAKFCLLMVKPRGSVTFIHRSDRLDQILAFFSGKLGNITIYPLWPGKNKPAKRVLIRGIKNTHGTLRLVPGMVLHNDDGRYTVEADRVLRDAAAIAM
ncbi:MAG: methyltransferase domain-containing protein [Alphaproteobacteria bacterium]|jgi:tRNA1(Val) A37 N6-methylase TrmN6|nr:methyltransferase domain-containing protein [Alphaproteobacteria bacterium]